MPLIFLLEFSCFTMLLVSAVRQSESATHVHVPFFVTKSTEQSSLCCTIGSHWLSVSHQALYICQSQTPSLSHLHFPLGIHIIVLYICVSISALQIGSSVPFF